MTTLKVKLHEFRVSDSEDPDIYAADYLIKWEKSEAGQWAMKNSKVTPSWHRFMDHNTFGYIYAIYAVFTPEQLTYWTLKYE